MDNRFSNNFKELRKMQELTQEQIAILINTTQPQVSRIFAKSIKKLKILLMKNEIDVDINEYKKIVNKYYDILSEEDLCLKKV